MARLIPYGRVSTYGAIARFLGAAGSARMVGYAMKASWEKEVPAHRVVNRHGLLSGKHYFGGSELMADLLRSEGIAVEDDQVCDFQKLLWDPAEHLRRDHFI